MERNVLGARAGNLGKVRQVVLPAIFVGKRVASGDRWACGP